MTRRTGRPVQKRGKRKSPKAGPKPGAKRAARGAKPGAKTAARGAKAAARGSAFPDLCTIMARLLAPSGCPWDREQSLESLKPYLIEEAYEVLDAMDAGDVREHCDELGDLLFQIVFQSALREREGR